MKKFFAIIICAAVLLVTSLSIAAVDSSKIALGPVYPGMSVNDLVNACGQPTYRDEDDWTYPTFQVDIEYGRVEKVSTYSNALATPNGVRVGQSADVLNNAFGKADFVDYDDGGIEYKYFSIDMKKIEFEVMGGVITKITCKIGD